MEEDAAVKKALEQMGDPVSVGRQLQKVHRPKTEWSIILFTVLLIFIGCELRNSERKLNVSSWRWKKF